MLQSSLAPAVFDTTVRNHLHCFINLENQLMASPNKARILTAALKLSEEMGYTNVLKRHIAAKLSIGMGTVNSNYGTMKALRKAVVLEAINTSNNVIIAQALIAGDLTARRLTAARRAEALAALAA
jgi:AcrR family transcriptional regulator